MPELKECYDWIRPAGSRARCAILLQLSLLALLGCSTRSFQATLDGLSSNQSDATKVSAGTLGLPAVGRPQGLKLLWISLDGLTGEAIQDFLGHTPATHPFGFRYLASKAVLGSPMFIANPTITASSHTSTMTCTTAHNHGVYANQIMTSQGPVSGFRYPYTSDTFLAALKRAGWRTASLGYPGIDFVTPNRAADIGLAYPDPGGMSQLIPMSQGVGSGGAQVWTGRFQLSHRQSLQHHVGFEVQWSPSKKTANSKQSNTRSPKDRSAATLHWKGSRSTPPFKSPATPQAHVWPGEDWTHVFLDAGETRERFDVRIFAPNQEGTGDSVPLLYVSPGHVNDVHPSSYRQSLDQRRLVFASGKDQSLLRSVGQDAFALSLELRLATMEALAQDLLATSQAAAAFLYFEDLDVIGHNFSGTPAEAPFRRRHMAKLDRVLGGLIGQLDAQTTLVVAGDHGMSTIDYEFASRAFLPPAARAQLEVKAAGGALFYFARQDSAGTGVRSRSAVDAALADTRSWLGTLRRPDGNSQEGGRSDDNHADGSHELLFAAFDNLSPNSPAGIASPEVPGQAVLRRPLLAAYASPGISFVDTVEPGPLVALRRGVSLPDLAKLGGGFAASVAGAPGMQGAPGTKATPLPSPSLPGQHGHDGSFAALRTQVFVRGDAIQGLLASLQSGQTPGPRSPLRNTSLVPLVADALGIPRPEGCKAAPELPAPAPGP